MQLRYELEFQECDAVFGQPFSELVTFFESLPHSTVLDLGCGQGRDAIMIAGFNHTVHGVDLAPTGIEQMTEKARVLELAVTGEISDLSTYKPTQKYDVVVLDRVVHMMKNESLKRRLLTVAANAVLANGFLLIVDIPSNLPLIEKCFSTSNWELTCKKKTFRFFQKHERSN